MTTNTFIDGTAGGSGGGSGNATSIQGVAVSATAPTDGYVLTYVAANTDWEAKPASSGTFTAPTGTGLMTTTSGTMNGAASPVGTGVLTFLGTPSSANLASAITDETGSGSLMFGTSPTVKTSLLINNPTNTFAYTLTPGAITAARTLNIPVITGTDTLVVTTLAQTLTNKTLTAPVISSIVNTGTLTLPTATTTLAGIDTTDALTNKTIVAASNTITDTAAAVGDILKHNGTKFVRLGLGAANQVLTTNGTATDIAWANAAGGGFTAGGDLGGTSSSQTVLSITGSAGAVNIASTGNILTWNTATTAPGIKQADNTTASATAAAMTIQAANATGLTATGGTLKLTSGTGTTAAGPVILATGGTTRLTANASGVVTVANLGLGLVHADASGNLTSSTLVNADVSATAAVAVTKLAAGTSAQVLLNNATPAPTWTTLAGDMTVGSTGTTTVAKVNGASVPAAGALTTGNAAYVSGVSALTYSALNLSGGAGWITGTLPVGNGGTGLTSLGAGVATFLGTPSSANLLAAVTDETGTGALVFGTSPTISGPTLSGTPSISAATVVTSGNAKGVCTDRQPVNIQTTNATITTLDSFTIASGSTVVCSWLVTCIQSTSATAGAWSVTACFRNNAGTVAQVGTTTTTIIGTDNTAYTCTINNSTTTIRLQVTGVAATTLQWTGICTQLTVIP